jgi:hypothetical protein
MKYTVGMAALRLGVPYWRIHHAYRARKVVPEPERFNNQRQLDDADLRRLAYHFGIALEENGGEDTAGTTAGKEGHDGHRQAAT